MKNSKEYGLTCLDKEKHVWAHEVPALSKAKRIYDGSISVFLGGRDGAYLMLALGT